MKKKYKVITTAVVAALLVQAAVPSFASSVKDAQSNKASLEKKKDSLQNQIDDLQQGKDEVNSYIEKVDKKLNAVNDKIDATESNIKKTQTTLEKVKKELEQAEITEKSQYNTMKLRIKYMYENGSQDYVALLSKATSVSDLLNKAEYVEQISEYDRTLLDRYTETKEKITAKKAEQEASLKKLNSLNTKLTSEQKSMNTLISNKKTELAKYDSNINKTQGQVEETNAEIEKQEKLIADMLEAERKAFEEAEKRRKEAEAAAKKQQEEAQKQQDSSSSAVAGNNSSSNSSGSSNSGSSSSSATVGGTSSSGQTTASGGFTWPCPASRTITSHFGPRKSPTAGASSYHQGIDIGAGSGATIVAANSGTVVKASYSSGAGNYIMISHGNGLYTVYMHCSKLLVSSGQTVSKGQAIGKVGSTGVSTGPHLHFAVMKNGKYVNPLNYL
ncbi:membrane proteins related to metalloendopeptidases [Lachnospiraceae bacterium KM106-2]|nr:membrane proteins related to metalloendopeptidases [Lachnospiraceae bacterium KM106-2]